MQEKFHLFVKKSAGRFYARVCGKVLPNADELSKIEAEGFSPLSARERSRVCAANIR
jgi:hypothetical protein